MLSCKFEDERAILDRTSVELIVSLYRLVKTKRHYSYFSVCVVIWFSKDLNWTIWNVKRE